MSNERIVIDAPTGAVRGPWEQPVRPAFPVAVPATDPRLELSDQALVLASHNAYPIVARQKTRRDNLGLAAGGAVAWVLGCATFVSLSSSRHASTAPAPAAVGSVQAQTLRGVPMPAA